jgi:hypothetical protein
MVRYTRQEKSARIVSSSVLDLFPRLCIGAHNDTGVFSTFIQSLHLLIIHQLIIFRAFQGIGGGAIMTLVFIM